MALQITTNINVDFYDKKYIMLNAKQHDDNSRWIAITCYSNGDLFNLSNNQHTAYIRYKKADGNGVLNSCRINHKGEVLVELTEQMLAADGICYVDLIIVNKGSAIVNIDTGEIITVDGSAILSTMAFCINVYEAAVDNSLIESTYEYETNALNDILEKANADYKEVVQLAKSYAVGDAENIRENENFDNSKYYSRLSRSYAIGDADGVRDGEDADNAKYYSEQSANSANNASKSESNAKSHMDSASEHMNTAKSYMDTAEEYMNSTNEHMNTTKGYMDKTKEYMNTVDGYMNTTKGYMNTTQGHMTTTEGYMDNAETYMNNAKTSETNAKDSEVNASNSETVSLNNANKAQSYAVGGTGTRDGEDTNNSQYYYELTKTVVDGLNSGFIPMGTISFSELATAEKATGFTYNIRDDFVTNESFAEGAGKQYTAGTNVYIRYDGMFDCFGGAVSPTATVAEVKEYLGI